MAGGRDAAVERVAGLRYWRAREARVMVEAWGRSGEDLREFAEGYGIQARRLARWAERLEPEPADDAMRFHAVQLVEEQDRSGPGHEPIEIVLGEGCSVRVPAGFAAEDLERVLTVLAVGAAGC